MIRILHVEGKGKGKVNLKFACSDQFESAEEIAKGIQGYLPNL